MVLLLEEIKTEGETARQRDINGSMSYSSISMNLIVCFGHCSPLMWLIIISEKVTRYVNHMPPQLVHCQAI